MNNRKSDDPSRSRGSRSSGKGLQRPTEAELCQVAHFFFEAGMLKRTPRTGFQFLGSGKESVADHSFRVAVIGFALARLDDYHDPYRVVCLCLFHDMPEARTGDTNYVNKQYVKVLEEKAVDDVADRLPFGEEYRRFWKEYSDGRSRASKLAHDADQLDLILELKQQLDLGNEHAREWIGYAIERLQTKIGRKMASVIIRVRSTDWWFDGHDDWWIRHEP